MRSSSVGGTNPAGCFVDKGRQAGSWNAGLRILYRVLEELRRSEGRDTEAMIIESQRIVLEKWEERRLRREEVNERRAAARVEAAIVALDLRCFPYLHICLSLLLLFPPPVLLRCYDRASLLNSSIPHEPPCNACRRIPPPPELKLAGYTYLSPTSPASPPHVPTTTFDEIHCQLHTPSSCLCDLCPAHSSRYLVIRLPGECQADE